MSESASLLRIRSSRGGSSGASVGPLRCGIGNSLRAVRGQIGRFGRLLTDSGPDDVVRGLRSAPPEATASIAGFHLFPFGGLRKAGDWLRNDDRDPLVPSERATTSRAGSQNP